MVEVLQIAGSLGVGAFLGTLIFLMYQRDRKDTEKRIHDIHENHSERLEILLEKDQETRERNSQILTELIIWLRAKNGH